MISISYKKRYESYGFHYIKHRVLLTRKKEKGLIVVEIILSMNDVICLWVVDMEPSEFEDWWYMNMWHLNDSFPYFWPTLSKSSPIDLPGKLTLVDNNCLSPINRNSSYKAHITHQKASLLNANNLNVIDKYQMRIYKSIRERIKSNKDLPKDYPVNYIESIDIYNEDFNDVERFLLSLFKPNLDDENGFNIFINSLASVDVLKRWKCGLMDGRFIPIIWREWITFLLVWGNYKWEL